ncbi:LacI family transcriptional regulator [Prauserella marina]|uniref:LacI family transcriptional regulator n=1 Tax=Prauserella marina TaxID=530584 RepID=A0A222VV72_9PSEU|nr:LacI family DNA-binding transcriptional regulator [Prauserella marina]ASR37623.1 LacI family transcriptional regulator [Prauserella marina]PWV75536.1 LacI family transcriptional regulator [Prauserella marina]SDD32398.1 LacI family transcriptional regulator [Prauserella marina]
MTDVARAAGVSIKTVSRVVNAEAPVHPGTAAKVHAAIERLGFRRNAGARNLRTGSGTGTLGLIVEDIGNPFYSELHRAIERAAATGGRHVLAASSEGDEERERDLALEFCARRVDGLVIIACGERHDYLAAELKAGTPVVFVDRPCGELDADTVLADDEGGAAMAVAHLARLGHREIGFLGDAPEIHTTRQRLLGFRRGCEEAGIDYDERLVRLGLRARGTETDLADVSAALRDTGAATAIVTGNNRITVAALRTLAAGGRRPELVGFDDFELADLLDPPVSVVASDLTALGTTAAQLLLARTRGDRFPPKKVVLPMRLIDRSHPLPREESAP